MTVARVFKRSRTAIDAARQVQMRKVESDTYYRDRFIAILVRSMDPDFTLPELPPL